MKAKHFFFRRLLQLSTSLLPSFIYRDLSKLSKVELAIVAMRIWLAKKSLSK